MRDLWKKAVAICSAVVALPLLAVEGDPVTLQDTGANITGHINAAILALGAIAAVAVSGYFAFFIIKRGLNWASRMG